MGWLGVRWLAENSADCRFCASGPKRGIGDRWIMARTDVAKAPFGNTSVVQRRLAAYRRGWSLSIDCGRNGCPQPTLR
jgi:hypothetical protein